MKNSLFAFAIIFLLSACGAPGTTAPTSAPPPDATPPPSELMATPLCISSQPTEADIDRALTYTEDLFNVTEWERSYTVADGRVSVTWFNSVDSAVAYLEALIFPCTYEEIDLNDFFNTENWQVIFANYESYKPVAECKTNDGLRLYQFTAVEQGFEYNINYWAENDTDTRVIGMMIVFPIESKALMDEYSKSLFPDLTSCK
ncbi:MAG: hypothetical protein IH588_19035 [Anaerolineales bacterium]|nr:hypothetical protein [Anaerolineales bacterium]